MIAWETGWQQIVDLTTFTLVKSDSRLKTHPTQSSESIPRACFLVLIPNNDIWNFKNGLNLEIFLDKFHTCEHWAAIQKSTVKLAIWWSQRKCLGFFSFNIVFQWIFRSFSLQAIDLLASYFISRVISVVFKLFAVHILEKQQEQMTHIDYKYRKIPTRHFGCRFFVNVFFWKDVSIT